MCCHAVTCSNTRHVLQGPENWHMRVITPSSQTRWLMPAFWNHASCGWHLTLRELLCFNVNERSRKSCVLSTSVPQISTLCPYGWCELRILRSTEWSVLSEVFSLCADSQALLTSQNPMGKLFFSCQPFWCQLWKGTHGSHCDMEIIYNLPAENCQSTVSRRQTSAYKHTNKHQL